jgi:hypothetical protein
MNAKVVLVFGLLLFGGAVYALHTDKMQVLTICRDSRLYMDGGIDAELEGGGLNYHHATKLFRRKNNEDFFISEFPVTSETLSKEDDQVYLSANNVKLAIFRTRKPTQYGYPGHLDAKLDGQNISVNVVCMNKSL